MSVHEDDDAFRWDGDDDPTLSVTPESVASSAAVAAPDPEPEPVSEVVEGETYGIGNVALVAYGVLGGVYALWTAGCVIGALRLKKNIEGISGSVADFMFQGSMVLAILAPAIWFLVSVLGTRGKHGWQKFLWLAVGVLVLIPWPLMMLGIKIPGFFVMFGVTS